MAECQLQEKLQHTILVTCTVDVAEGQVHHDIQSHGLFVVHGLWCHFLCLQQGGFRFFFLHLRPLLNSTQSQWLLEGNVTETCRVIWLESLDKMNSMTVVKNSLKKSNCRTGNLVICGPNSESVLFFFFFCWLTFLASHNLYSLSLIHISEPTRRA